MSLTNLFKSFLLLLLCTSTVACKAQNRAADAAITRLEPPHWYIGMADNQLQLLVYGPGIANYEVVVAHPGVVLAGTERVANPNYLFINLVIGDEAQAGAMQLTFKQGKRKFTRGYTLESRRFPDNRVNGFGPQDLMYLIMPDRFANGDPKNDVVAGMQEVGVDRQDNIKRHGGDLAGILQQLNYIQELAVTTLWLNPVQENNQPRESYHGYAMTDLYKIDPRLGTNADYYALVAELRKRDMKMVMDLVHNHLGNQHWLMLDLPDSSWVNHWDSFTRTSYRAVTQLDPYAAESDKAKMARGWFDTHMPDLNQQNPLLAQYLIQNNIWWVETAGLNGFRLDTYAYPDIDFVNRCVAAIRAQYPDIGIVGEVWVHTVAESAYWTEGNKLNPAPQSLPGVTDFPLYDALRDGLNERFDWATGLRRIYYTLAQDGLYGDANRNVIFLDNHDISRAWAIFKQDMERMKMAHGLLLTLRGIPQLYYGSELLFGNYAEIGGVNVRQDMPGGWPSDSVNAFLPEGRNQTQQELFDYISTIAQWRKGSQAIAQGDFKHYVPEDEVYVYFRRFKNELVMVLVNSSDQVKQVDASRFSELKAVDTVYEVMAGELTTLDSRLEVAPKSVRILDIRIP